VNGVVWQSNTLFMPTHQRPLGIGPLLERLHDTLDIPVVYVSHAPDEVARLADHIVVMQQGCALAAGPLTETLARLELPIHPGEDAAVVLQGVVLARDTEWQLAHVAFEGGSLWVRDGGAGDRPVGTPAHTGARCQHCAYC
jgi:molybdate transport system ATP-binding protein